MENVTKLLWSCFYSLWNFYAMGKSRIFHKILMTSIDLSIEILGNPQSFHCDISRPCEQNFI
jgi:hypothetical protein